MLDRGHRETRPFGARGADRRPEAWAPDPVPEIPGWDAPKRPPGPLPWALRTAALVGLAAVLVTQYLAHSGAPGTAAAVRVARGPASLADPETTGSLGGPAADARNAARATRLDPCALAASARPRP